MGDLFDMSYFEQRLRSLVAQLLNANPSLSIDIDSEITYYKSIRNQILPMITDTIHYTNNALQNQNKILIEGANATMIDLDFGTYPFVTSSNPSIGSVCTGLGIAPQWIQNVTGIVKCYCTRVGEGPFPTEAFGDIGETLRQKGGEYGTTTGRSRRCGWIDIPQIKYAATINGFTNINLTKVDVLTGFDTIRIGTRYKYKGRYIEQMPSSINMYNDVEVEYEDMPGWKENIQNIDKFDQLPENCKNFIRKIEKEIGVPIKWIGVGQSRNNIIVK